MSKFHSILFLLESKNHCAKALYVATVQKCDAVSVQCVDSVLSLRFRGVPLGSVIIIWFLRQSQGKSLGLLWSPALVAPSRL